MMPIFLTEHFKRQMKQLEKKFPHVKEDVFAVLKTLKIENEISIGRSIYKIRIGSRDMKRGKSGAFRSYIYLYRKKNFLVPLCIYVKSSQESLTENELHYHFAKAIEELVTML
ncbi:hypothetical protein HYV58_01825 [Candidatus Peregrinibacteria bacterium]|nr:hypothetical protein [Candidatus Peregrinibacteria bacterium]